MRFSGKAALITGGASGLGLEVARQLHGEGASLVLVDWDVRSLELAAAAVGARHVRGDVSQAATAATAGRLPPRGVRRPAVGVKKPGGPPPPGPFGGGTGGGGPGPRRGR